MIPFGELYKLLYLCLQTLNEEKLCESCLNGVQFHLEPQLSIHNSYFNHPDVGFYSLNSPTRRIIQKKISLVYKLLYFLEEMLLRLSMGSHEALPLALLDLASTLRNARIFPKVKILPHLSIETLNSNNKCMRFFFEAKNTEHQ